VTSPPSYFSYLLRLWCSNSETPFIWRASLENPMTGERHGFENLKNLFAFLEATTAVESSHLDNTDENSTTEV
jgi:hypothetical protein